ncbi:hypothetical protein JKA73_06355 [Myxococcus xanthus]|uniref:hypothetical protein n=1 Tax=Myxococcus xanthus TaxID=34 RepID=UPI00191779B8|nr:hypothetical protein [Myxococcus xanthus]QQR45749.1 hypothetical protein JKA73_06355 [Myxococcus xanthus]
MSRSIPIKGLGAAALAAILASGCEPASQHLSDAPLATQAQRTTYRPQFCAFVPYVLECVYATQSPQLPYDAIFNGLVNRCDTDLACRFQPIKLWATAPDVGASTQELATWLDAQQRVVDFLKNSNRSADSLMVSLEAQATERRSYGRDQDVTIAAAADRIDTILGNAAARVKQAAREYGDPVVVEEAEVKAGMVRLEQTLAESRAALEALSLQVVAVADQFRAYKDTEPAITMRLHTLAAQGSAADLEGLVTAQLEAVALAQQESGDSSAVVQEVMRLRTRLALLQEEYVERLGMDAAFIAQRGLHMGDLVDGELEMLGGMRGYCETRRRKVLTTVDRLLEGMKQRRDALIGLESNEATRQALADAAFLSASQRFLDGVTARSTQLWQVAPKSSALKLSFLSEKFDQMESYLQFEPACAPPTAGQRSWRETGCVAMRRDFSRVRTWMSSTLPGTLRLNVAMMRNAGTVPAALLAEVEAKLAAGQLKAAASVHDAALRVSDGL